MMVDVILPFDRQPLLWQNTAPGMSIDDVRRAQPGVRKPSDAEPLGTGITPELEIRDFALNGDRYRVVFYFDRRGLRQVTLHTQEQPALRAAAALMPLLCSKYGDPFRFDGPAPDDVLPRLIAEW